MQYESYLQHHGIKGQKWGVCRYINEDGSLTNAEKKGTGLRCYGIVIVNIQNEAK